MRHDGWIRRSISSKSHAVCKTVKNRTLSVFVFFFIHFTWFYQGFYKSFFMEILALFLVDSTICEPEFYFFLIDCSEEESAFFSLNFFFMFFLEWLGRLLSQVYSGPSSSHTVAGLANKGNFSYKAAACFFFAFF